jgi:formylmethanofuran dehydrogenase subunit C
MKKEQILGVIRHTLTFIGGIVIMKGIADEATITEIIGGIITVTGAIWSILEKRA